MATTPLLGRWAERGDDGVAGAAARGDEVVARSTRWKGDDAVPSGLAAASAVTLRVLIIVAGIVIVAIGAARLMLLVLPVIISVLLTTLHAP